MESTSDNGMRMYVKLNMHRQNL